MANDSTLPPRLAFIIPCFNEEEVLITTHERISSLLASMQDNGLVSDESQICFVDDGSKDRTWELISELAQRDLQVIGVRLSRNRGHQNALLAGLFEVDAECYISIDADLQDDIAVVPDMMIAHREGNDIVYGVRRRREQDTWFKRHSAEAFYHILSLFGVDIVCNHADFRLMSQRAVNALKKYDEVNLFLRGIVPQLGFPSTTVEYDRRLRLAGETKYPLKRMLAFALDGITSFTAVPLRAFAVLGIFIFLGSLVVTGWVFWVRLFTDQATPGWASSVLPIYFLGGIQIFAIGVIGEYLAKAYAETKGRPRYVVQDAIRIPLHRCEDAESSNARDAADRFRTKTS